MSPQVDQVLFQCIGMIGVLIGAVGMSMMHKNDIHSQGLFFFGVCIALFCLMRKPKV